jgi:hypothetical protein
LRGRAISSSNRPAWQSTSFPPAKGEEELLSGSGLPCCSARRFWPIGPRSTRASFGTTRTMSRLPDCEPFTACGASGSIWARPSSTIPRCTAHSGLSTFCGAIRRRATTLQISSFMGRRLAFWFSSCGGYPLPGRGSPALSSPCIRYAWSRSHGFPSRRIRFRPSSICFQRWFICAERTKWGPP